MRSALPLFAFAVAVSAPALAVEIVLVPAFRGIELRGGGTVVLTRGPVQRVTITEGSSAFTRLRVDRRGKLTIDACNQRCPRHYRLRIEVQSPRVPDVAIMGGGTISVASGFAPQSELSAAVNGGGRIDAHALDAANVSAAINGGGRIDVLARRSLSAAVNGGGDIRYWGNPDVAMAVQGGGLVRRAN